MTPTAGGPPPARFLPALVNEDLADFVRDRTLDATPWAAYTLGFQSQLAPFHLGIAGTAPQLGMDCFEAVPQAVYETGLACDALVAVTPSQVAAELRRVITLLDAYNDSLARGLFIRNRLERDLAHERQLGDSMVIFADHAIPASSPLSHWYALGRALGEFRQRAQRETADALAPLRPVAEAARGVGQEHLGRVPELSTKKAKQKAPASKMVHPSNRRTFPPEPLERYNRLWNSPPRDCRDEPCNKLAREACSLTR